MGLSLNSKLSSFVRHTQNPASANYYRSLLELCPPGTSACELVTSVRSDGESPSCSGFAAIWLAQRGVISTTASPDPATLECLRQVSANLGADIDMKVVDIGSLFAPEVRVLPEQPRYHLIHSADWAHMLSVPEIKARLAQQLLLSNWVAFTVPSMFAGPEWEWEKSRLLPLEEWRRILSVFEIEQLDYLGDETSNGRANIVAILRGRPGDGFLQSLISLRKGDYNFGISAIVHVKNEALRIRDCLSSLRGWTDEIIVCDMDSDDDTVSVAQECGAEVISHCQISNFDRARNASAMRARHKWVFYLDADERVPAILGQSLRQAVVDQESVSVQDRFDAVLPPFRHHFAGHWMRSLYPGYTAPRLLRNGHFYFNTRLHSGAEVDGKVVLFPADDPSQALVHFSYDSISHYLEKMNRYTDGESQNMVRDGRPFNWKSLVEDAIRDCQGYYDGLNAAQDAGHGFIYSILGGFYRFAQHSKLYESRYASNSLTESEIQVPSSLEEVLEHALYVCRQGGRARQPDAIEPPPRLASSETASVLWSGPVLSPSGYGEQSRNHLLGFHEQGIAVAAHYITWGDLQESIPENESRALIEARSRPLSSKFVHIVHNFPPGFGRQAGAMASVGRTVFETDRLPTDWVKACNQMDYVWVSSEFNRKTFSDAGVQPEKLRVFPEALDPTEFATKRESSLIRPHQESGKFVFLTVFDWTLHKGWDVLLTSFLTAFEAKRDVVLVMKVWSPGYSIDEIRGLAQSHVREKLNVDILADPRVVWLEDRLSREDMLGLFSAADCFVLPSRGEGWGRPYMEAMASGTPVIGGGWGGNTAFMNSGNSQILPFTLVDVPEQGWTEIPWYKGHRWGEPDEKALVETLLLAVSEKTMFKSRAVECQPEILHNLDRKKIAANMLEEVEAVMEQRTRHLHLPPDLATPDPVFPGEVDSVSDAERIRIRWEGPQFSWHSFGHVNREICLALLARNRVELSLVPTEEPWFSADEDPRFQELHNRIFSPLGGPPDVHIRHSYPPRLFPQGDGKLVLIQPWEYGFLPEEWVGAMNDLAQEVWYYSSYERDVLSASGVDTGKIRRMPLGINPETFRPEAIPFVFTDEPGSDRVLAQSSKAFKFLFVGGTLERKGFDILIEAYRRAFSPTDDVCLVIKDSGTQSVYRGMNARENILELIRDRSTAPLVYLEDDMSPWQVAGIYTACDCYVHPYRGEGFALPVLEAMACGLPVVVTSGGPTDDFVDEAVGWRLPARKKECGSGPDGRRFGDFNCAGPVWMFEVEIDDLANQMREIYENREDAVLRGEQGSSRARQSWTWDHSAIAVETAAKCLKERAFTKREGQIISPKPSSGFGQIWTPGPVAQLRDENHLTTGGHRIPEAQALLKRALPKISLCMIVRDEERVLGDCLQSASRWFDEVIVVDTGSADATIEIAESHGAQVFHFPWCDDFAAARNCSIDHAAGDWIFWMDADDTLPPECGKKIRELAATAPDDLAGYIAQVHIPAAPGEVGFTVVDHVKLFRNKPGHRFIGRIHEQILEPIHQAGGRVDRSNVYVIHSGYDYSVAGQAKKRVRDLSLLEKDLADRPDHPFVLFNIGMTAYHMKDYEKAEPVLERCLQRTGEKESIVRKVYAMLAGCALEQLNIPQAREWVKRGLAIYPHDPELLFRAGIIFKETGNLEAAAECYQRLLTAPETGHIDSLDVTMRGFKAHHNLALIYLEMRMFDRAAAHFEIACRENPNFAPSQDGLKEARYQLAHLHQEARAG